MPLEFNPPGVSLAHLSLEDIYPVDVAEYGHMRVGMTDFYVREHCLVEGMTLGEFRAPTTKLLRDEAVQVQISAQLSALPDDYDPWLWRIERRRRSRLSHGDRPRQRNDCRPGKFRGGFEVSGV